VIPRYSRKEMSALWSDEKKYALWLDVEKAVCAAMTEQGLIPADANEKIQAARSPEASRVEEIEKITRHDVIAFLTALEEQIGDAARYVHLGMTSSDVLDTSFALQLKAALDAIIRDLDELCSTVSQRAHEFKKTPTIGRSHGIHAEPTTYGLVLAGFYAELMRDKARLRQARENIAFGKISGAVGTFAHLDPSIEARACEILGLKPDPVSTQIVQRDRHAEVFASLAILAGTMERMALDVRHRMRTEVNEVQEPFKKGQKGSSAMPHKRNPILSENVTGIARLIRSTVVPALENQALWHERDISHSSVERITALEATVLTDFILDRLEKVFRGLVVDTGQMQANLEMTGGLVFSQGLLLKLARKGVARQKAYVMVQRNALKAFDQKKPLKDLILSDRELMSYLDEKEVEESFSMKPHLEHVDYIFERVFDK